MRMRICADLKHGFTLIEFIITIFIFLIISTAGLGVLTVGRKAWYVGDSQLIVQQEARRGMDSMVRELRQAGTNTITGVPADGNYYSSITFRIPNSISSGTIIWSDQIQYFVGGLNNQQLIRQSGSGQRVLANKVSSLRFKRNVSTPQIIGIEITTQKETFAGLSSRVSNITLAASTKLRN